MNAAMGQVIVSGSEGMYPPPQAAGDHRRGIGEHHREGKAREQPSVDRGNALADRRTTRHNIAA